MVLGGISFYYRTQFIVIDDTLINEILPPAVLCCPQFDAKNISDQIHLYSIYNSGVFF